MTDHRKNNEDNDDEIEEGAKSIHGSMVPGYSKQIEKKSTNKLHSNFFLPPIDKCGESSMLPKSAKSPSSHFKVRSHYHRGCISGDNFSMNRSSNQDKKIKPRTREAKSGSKDTDIIKYLDHNQELLEAYIIESVSVNKLECWLDKKLTRNLGKIKADESAIKDTSKNFFMNLETKLQQNSDQESIVLELALHITLSVTVDAYRVFKLDSDNPGAIQFFVTESPNDIHTCTELAEAETDIVAFILDVAINRKCLRLSREKNAVFPSTPRFLLKTFGIENVKQANHLLYQPILTGAKTIYVIEMWRIRNEFDIKDEEMCANLLTTFHYCNLFLVKQRESDMSDFLLNVVTAIFEKMISLNELIKSILKSAQRLVNADRASLFLVDNSNAELVSTVFDLKFDQGQDREMEKTIRMPINRGIAGYVATTGETVNISDAYSDSRFNSEVDEATGYKTKSILCMPIKIQGKVIGVVEMVNKLSNCYFDHADEVAFEKFSTFFGLALHNAGLYEKIMKKERSYKVALEILSYHNTCKTHEVQEVQNENRAIPANINDFYLDPYELDNLQKCKAAIKMFDNLFELSNFDLMAVTKFILTVKKNYRTVPYHNFDHGWSVAHAMYVILQNDLQQRFDYKMKLALFVASLCHDLDHRGYTNKYMHETASPLAAMYTTSPLEHHHFSITVIILQQDGHNIFSHLSSEDYKEVLQYIKHCILATDLAAFFPNLTKLEKIYAENSQCQQLNWAISSHRDLAMALSMTAADLSASAKPWNIQIKTVEVIFEEFYGQGDKEREAGKTPIPMMDRNKPEEQPASQVGFLSQICIPCYSMLYKILPETKPMYVMASKNLDSWKSKVNIDPEKDVTLNERQEHEGEETTLE